jgi:predicted dehydrogenase
VKIGIIGCGLIGKKRALVLESDDILVACCDTNIELGQKFAIEFNCEFYENYSDLLTKDCDTIIVSVINKFTKEIVKLALELDKNVLVEKPMGKNFKESLCILINSKDKMLKVGFNHRFHPAIWKAKELFDAGSIGKLMFIRGIYGHGGRPGMETEWRASKDLCGGGELLDQGVHLIDLSRWFAGDIKTVFGKVSTKFWNIEVEDNAFMLLQSINDVDIQLNVSWTNWKNTFQFEIFGTDGYLKINGLGRWYGKETLEFGKRKIQGGVPDIEVFEYDDDDISWIKEWQEFKSAIKVNRQPIGNGVDGGKANQIIDALYKSSTKNKIIKIK